MIQSMNILWVDFLANGSRLADESEQWKLIERAEYANITHVVIDGKVPFGQTTYPSQYTYPISSWSDGSYKMWKDRDFLQEFLKKMTKSNLKVLVNIDVFSEGITTSKDGLVYDKKDWKVISYNEAVSNQSNAAEYNDAKTIFVNPINPEVVEHELKIIKEVCMNYEIDGIVLDRCRYPNIYGDFSNLSKEAFENYIGSEVPKWPEDILTLDSVTKEVCFGPLFAKWTEWRALNIKTFVQKARRIVKSINPAYLFADYVGSWYPLYYNEGINWASETYKPELEWTSKTYYKTGLAEELDFIMTGCYYPEVTVEEARINDRPADWYSVEGAVKKSLEVTNNKIPVIGSLFLKDYINNSDQFRKAIRMCKSHSAGVMLFDTVYIEQYGWWDILHQELKNDQEHER